MSPPRHFWPGEGDAHRRPGAVPVCGARAVPLIATAIPSQVTCRSCARIASPTLKAAIALGRVSDPVLWPDARLEALGMLAPGAPPAAPRAAPYRNPHLVDPGRSPLAALVARLRASADERALEARRLADDAPGTAAYERGRAAAFQSAAAELDDAIAMLARGW